MKALSTFFYLLFAICVRSLSTGIQGPPPVRPSYQSDDGNRVGSSGRKVSRELFSSLEELARIVDITYCVGTTGIYKPFRCAGRCREFEGFELVTVSTTRAVENGSNRSTDR